MESPRSKEYSKVTALIAALPIVALFFLYLPTLTDIAFICWTDDDYSHGLVLPFVIVYILWQRKNSINDSLTLHYQSISAMLAGGLLLVCGLLLFFIGDAAHSGFASWLSFFPSLIGALLLVFNFPTFLLIAPPMLLLFMAKPLPDSLVPLLFGPFQNLAAHFSARILELLNVPVYTLGNVIEIPGMRLMVEEACSGMRSLMALLTVSIIVVFLVNLPLVYKFLILVISVITALVLNVFRVALTGILAHFVDPRAAQGFFHTFSGMIVFIIGLAIVYYVGVKFQKISSRKR